MYLVNRIKQSLDDFEQTKTYYTSPNRHNLTFASFFFFKRQILRLLALQLIFGQKDVKVPMLKNRLKLLMEQNSIKLCGLKNKNGNVW